MAWNLLVRDQGASRTFDHVSDRADHLHNRMSRFSAGAGVAMRRGGAAIAAFGRVAGSGMAAVGAAAVASGAIVGKSLFNTAVSVEAMGNKSRLVFGQSERIVSAWAGRTAEKLGLTRTQAKAMASSFGDILTPMGFTQRSAAGLSTQLSDMVGAFVQWSNGTADASNVADAFADALTGDFESLKQYGVVLDQDRVQALMAAKGLGHLTGAARSQAEAQVALAEIMRQSKTAMQSFEGGANKLGLAKQRLKARFGELKESLATSLIPSFERGTTWLADRLTPAAGRLSAWVKTEGVPAFRSFAGFVNQQLVPRVKELWHLFESKGLPVLRRVTKDALGGLMSAFRDVRAAVERNRPTIEQLWAAYKKFADFMITKVWPLLGPILHGVFRTLGFVISTSIQQVSNLVRIWNIYYATTRTVLAAVVRYFMSYVGSIVTGAAKAFAWVPGLGPKLATAAQKFGEFRDRTNRALSGISDRNVNVGLKVNLRFGSADAAEAWRMRGHGGDVTIGAPPASAGPGGWPLPAGFRHITSPFGARRGRGIHRGTDIAAPTGTPVYATLSGRVIQAGWAGSAGNMVSIAAGNMVHRFMHLSRVLARAGSTVGARQQIGAVGSTGQSTGPHLHWQVERGGFAINPMGRRALGGPAHAHRSYLLGEWGEPEILTMGARSGHLTPISKLGQPAAAPVMASSPADDGRPIIVQLILDGKAIHQSMLRLKTARGGAALGLD